jgi:FAD/FMN-containing dehydrogenase
VVRACAAHGVPLVPQGGNTGLVGGGVPDATGRQVVLSTRRMNRVREVDALNLSITVEAGCTLHEVQQAAAAHDLLFPLSLASEGQCTIGGNLATNAGGTQVLRYGTARELCLGLEVVTAQGEIWDGLRALRKDNAGYALRELYIGSEGTLGLITAATLRLFPRPRAQACALVACADLPMCVELLAAARAAFDARLCGFEAMNQASTSLVRRHFADLCAGWPQALEAAPWLVLMDLGDVQPSTRLDDDLQAFLHAQQEQGRIGGALLAHSLAQQRALWQMRESISSAQSLEGLNVKHDIALPVSRLADFVSDTTARVLSQWPGVRPITFGHLGDGNLHYNFQAPPGDDPAAFLARHEPAINALVFERVRAHGGSIAAEHGIGLLRRDALVRHAPPAALGTMRAIKRALDPQDLFNPGRVV